MNDIPLKGKEAHRSYLLQAYDQQVPVLLRQKAFLHNQLIVAFKETLHNATYVAPDHVYAISDADDMISDVKMLLLNEEMLDQHIELQHQAAQLEHYEAYVI